MTSSDYVITYIYSIVESKIYFHASFSMPKVRIKLVYGIIITYYNFIQRSNDFSFIVISSDHVHHRYVLLFGWSNICFSTMQTLFFVVISRLHLVTSSDYTYNESIRLECFSCKIFRILLGENYRSSNNG